MPRNSAISNTQATYGCVDWYIYTNSPAAPASASGAPAGSALPAPCTRIIERAVAAAGAKVMAVTRAAAPPECATQQSAC